MKQAAIRALLKALFALIAKHETSMKQAENKISHLA
jgi:hypothetical protein